ncbi:MAG TPA: thiamine pyrophosphate-dependent enzyme [Candidatus Angelobacter sp.]|nr:thiamine pyrophosphate-dependent enzyme [Candidatus Angelobacter sp.]
MPRKKKNKPAAIARKQRGKSSKSKSSRKPSAKKPRTKKQKTDEILPVLNAEKLKELYATMVKCRMLAERMQSERTVNSSVLGFEAALVGAGAHLLSKDCIALEQDSFVASLIKGTPLHAILARNKAHQSNGAGTVISSKQGDNDMTALTLETVLNLAADMKGKNAVVLMFSTQDAGALRFDSAAMAKAATQKLPLVCLVESSLDSPLELPNQIASGPYIGADPTFYPRIPVDGCDVVGVFRVAQEAIRRAREGHGPAVIECMTARSSTRTIKKSEQASSQYLAQDPLSFMEQYLRRRNLWSDDWSQSIIQGFEHQLSEAAASLKNPDDSESQFDNVYSHRPAAALAQ